MRAEALGRAGLWRYQRDTGRAQPPARRPCAAYFRGAFGGVEAGPMHAEKGLLSAEIDVARARASRRKFDVAGHYARPDIFTLSVNRAAQPPVRFGPDDTSGA